jgi:hypothetical protein
VGKKSGSRVRPQYQKKKGKKTNTMTKLLVEGLRENKVVKGLKGIRVRRPPRNARMEKSKKTCKSSMADWRGAKVFSRATHARISAMARGFRCIRVTSTYLRIQLCNNAASAAETRLVPRPKNHRRSVRITLIGWGWEESCDCMELM